MRRYANMPRDHIRLAIEQERDMLAAIERYQAYLESGGLLPKDEQARQQLQLSNSRITEHRRENIRDFEAELTYRDQNGID
jgi:hypothetical protein